MNQKPCQFYSFLQAVRGNWRNALLIRCSGSLCPMIRQASCEGFLMAADAGCQPIFLSVQTVRKLSGEAVDPEECSAILECRSFRTAYTKFLEWHTSSDHVDPRIWYETQGRSVLETLISDLNSRGHSKLTLREDGDICIEQGEDAVSQEHLNNFPQKVYWPRLAEVLESNGLAAEVTAQGIQVSW